MGKLTKYTKSTDVEAALDKGVDALGKATEAITKTTELKEDLNEINAEVQNARVGANGTSYQTIKARLDAENTNINEKIGDFKSESIEINYTETVSSKGFKTRNIGDEIGEPASTSGYSYRTYSVNPGEKLTIQTSVGSSSLYAFYGYFVDENGKVVDRVLPNTETGLIEVEHTVPENAKTLYLNYNHKNIGTFGEMFVKKEFHKTIQEQLDEINKKIEYIIPEGNKIYVNENIAKIVEKCENNCYLTFAFLTDTHSNEHNADECIESVSYLAEKKFVDAVIHGGDIISSDNYTDTSEYIKDLSKAIDKYKLIPDMFFCKGNHEVKNGFTMYQYYRMTSRNKNVVRNESDLFGGYYLVDYPEYKTRVFILNEYETSEASQYSAKQKQWLYDKLNEVDLKSESWNVICVSHMYGNGEYNILQAYAEKGTTYGDYTFSADGKGILVGYIHGHEHADRYDNSSRNYNIIGTTCGYEIDGMYAYDIFCLDTDNRKLHAYRVGRGNDREFSY